MIKLKLLLIGALCSLFMTGCERPNGVPVTDENGPGRLTQEDTDRIKKLNVRVGGDANYPPFVYKDSSGRLVGLSVDFFEESAKRLGLKYEITFVGQRAEMLKQLQEKKIDVTLASRTASSRPYLIVTQPYEYSAGTLLVRKGFDPATIKIVGAGRGYASVTWLRANKPQYSVLEVEDDTACVHELVAKTVDACIMGREIAFYILEKQLKLKLSDFDLTPIEYNYFLSFGVHTDNLELVDILVKGLALIPNERRREILSKWLKEPYL